MDVLGVGKSIPRKEAEEKVTGAAKYSNDHISPGILHAKMVNSPYAHAEIISINRTGALRIPGVIAIVTGDCYQVRCGPVIEDRPPIAVGKVRYFGEPVAVVVAHSEQQAQIAAELVKVEYGPLPVVNSLQEALSPDAPLVHENLGGYTYASPEVKPEPGTNINNRIIIRKGDMDKGWAESDVVVETRISLPQADHSAMETRNARAEIKPDGQVIIHTSSQAPFAVRNDISRYFGVDIGRVVVNTPLVGGAFGGKASVQLEMIAYLASKAVGGRTVKLSNTREEDLVTSPVKLGLEARIKLGATWDGILKAAEITYLLECGAYADTGPRMCKAMAVDCTGPYNIENLWCDSLCVYTNHLYVTSFRGFGHASYTFAIERAMDKLAYALGIDPLELRLINAIAPGHTSPTQVKLTSSNVGSLAKCILKLRGLINWDEGIRIETGYNKVRAKGLSCFWKTSDSPTDAVSGAVIVFNQDGSINLSCGAVEIGPGMRTTAAQILAEKMRMDANRIHVPMDVNTRRDPKHWKTVASMTTFMLGRAVIEAAEDAISQLLDVTSVVLRCPREDLEVGGERVFLKDAPDIYLPFPDIVHGFKYPNGKAIGGPIVGHGSFVMRHLTLLDPATGKGKPGPGWTVGVQAVEVEYDKRDYTYRILKAATVLDAGKVINPRTARGLVTGGMCMGLSLASRESFFYSESGEVENTSLRTYKTIRYGENPEYLVDFVETPQEDAPYGARGFGEHGIIGVPAALGNCLSTAAEVELNQLPLVPELIWKAKGGLIS